MMQLDPPAVCALECVDDAVERAVDKPHERLFADNRREWRRRVQEYINRGGDPQAVPSWPLADANGEIFRDLYRKPSKRSVSGRFVHDLKNHEHALCPSCGSPGRPNTRDHYLPQAHWPHFAATPANLSPMCSTCQGHKGDDTGNPRFFIHPYFDRFSQPRLLALTISPPFGAPTFQLVSNPLLSIAERALVDSHIRRLRIDERFITFFKTEHRRLIRLASAVREQDGGDIEALMTATATAKADPTVNGWEHVFYAAVVETPALMRYLRSGVLPPYP